MPSDSVSSFLELARANRIVLPDVFDDLLRGPGVPQENVADLCDVLQRRGVLTRFQADALRDGRGDDLTFAGYPVIDELGPCPGGTAFRIVHPSLRSPLILRRLRAGWLGPSDNLAAFVKRARDAAPVIHPHLARLLDAGVYRDEAFVVLDPLPGADLQTLVADIGPMPTSLAALYLKQVASALATVHAKGLVHGFVRPGVLFAGPLVPMPKLRDDGTPRMRPGPTAVVTLCELGLTPRYPPAGVWSVAGIPITTDAAYLPPERIDTGEPTSAGDIYGLGATVYFLLTGRPPVEASDPARLIDELRKAQPPALEVLRPDVPAHLVALVQAMLATDAAARPTAANVVARLSGPDELAAPPVEPEVPLTAAPPEDLAPLEPAPTEPADGFAVDESDGWATVGGGDQPFPGWGEAGPAAAEPVYHDPGFDPHAPAGPQAKAAEQKAAAPFDRQKLYMWLGIGLGLQLLAVAGWILFVTQPSWLTGGSSAPQPKPPKVSPTKKGGSRAG